MRASSVHAEWMLPVLLVLALAGCGGAGSSQSGSSSGSSASSGAGTGSGGGSGSSTGSSGSGSSTGSSGSGGGSSGGSTTNLAPVVSGTPAFAVSGMPFDFTPSVVDPEGDALTFSASNLPTWISFDTATGRFYGTPTSTDEGIYSNVDFTVSDGTNTVTVDYTFITAPDALEEAILTGDHRFVTDEAVYVNALYDAIDADAADGSLGTNEEAVKTLVQNLENDTFTFDLISACYNIGRGSDCTDTTYQNEFGKTAAWLKSVFDTYDTQKYDLFAHADAPRYQKLVVLLADHIRSTISLPVSIGDPHDFLRALFADHIVHVYRDINPAQPDMGNFSRSDFSGVTPTTSTVDIVSRKPFRAAGVYALPGQTVEVTRNDASPVTVKVAVNTVRDLAVRLFAIPDRLGTLGYNRPKFVTSPWIEIAPGETIRFTSPYGGPLELAFDTDDQPVTLTFGHIGHQPFWSGPQDTDSFLAALAADQYDWAEFVTPDFEIHTRTSYMQNTLIKPWVGGDPDLLYDDIVNMYMYYPRELAGYQGDGIGVLAEVQSFATANGLDIKQYDYVQHMNADQAACSTACGGNPIDIDGSFDPYSVTTDMHELGHSLEPARRFTGWGLHTTTDLYANYAEYRTQGTSGLASVVGCYDRDYQGLFDIVQASRSDADPGATMRADISANDAHGLMVFQQLMAMAQNEGTLVDGWDLLPEWQIIERDYFEAIGSDTLWTARAAGMGFGGMSRTDAAALSQDDLLLIILSKVENRNLSSWLELWGVQLSDAAKQFVASQGYPDAPLVYYALTNTQSCDTFTATSVPIDGVSPWPL